MRPANSNNPDNYIAISLRYGIVAGLVAVAIVGAVVLLEVSIGNRFEAGSGDLTIPESLA
jgi:Flp pilus assembly pilin Flp